jgi:hypothetical protein
LRFWRSDEDTDRLRANVNHVDHVFMMLDFISHSAENIVKEHPGYERVTGGMSSLRNKLAGLQPH